MFISHVSEIMNNYPIGSRCIFVKDLFDIDIMNGLYTTIPEGTNATVSGYMFLEEKLLICVDIDSNSDIFYQDTDILINTSNWAIRPEDISIVS